MARGPSFFVGMLKLGCTEACEAPGDRNVRFCVAPRGFSQQKLKFFYENASLFLHFSIFLFFLLLRQFCKHR